MSMIRTLAMIAALTTGSVAFADKPAATPDKTAKQDTVSDADAQRFYAFIDKLIAIAVANQDDCPKLAAGINAHVEANKALLKEASEMKQHNKELPPAIKEKITKRLTDELQPAVAKKCGKERVVIEAFQKIKAH